MSIRTNPNYCSVALLCAVAVLPVVWTTAVASAPSGVMYVTDINYGYVSKLDLATGAPLGGFATVSYPQGLAFDGTGNLYVALYYGNRIESFTPSGIRSVFAATGLSNPTTLAFDRAGNLYAANTRDGTIEKFTPNGEASVFASNLPSPYGMAFDSCGNLYVGLAGNNTIEKLTPSGERSVFANGAPIHSPCGLALDSADNVYAVNGDDGTIVRFTQEGADSIFVSTTSRGRLNLAFDASDNLYVSNIGNNTIERFTREGTACLFATGLHDPEFFVIQQVPEPSVFAMLSMVLFGLLARGKGWRPLRVISANETLHWTGSSRFCPSAFVSQPRLPPLAPAGRAGMKALGLRASELVRLPKDAPEKAALAWWLRQRTTARLSWIAQRLDMGHASRVSQAVARMRGRPGRRLRQLQRALSRVEHGGGGHETP